VRYSDGGNSRQSERRRRPRDNTDTECKQAHAVQPWPATVIIMDNNDGCGTAGLRGCGQAWADTVG